MNEVKRYVNLAFIIGGIILAWFCMKFAGWIISLTPLPDTRLMGEHVTYSTIIGIIMAGLISFLLWRNDRVHEGAIAVASEMKKVTWPTGDETKYAMKVVLAMSLIVSLILFLFDMGAKQLTDLILGI